MDTDFLKIVIIGFLMPAAQCDGFFKLSQISQDLEDVLHSIESPTITFCQMRCHREPKCQNIGFTKDSVESSFFNCRLLGKQRNANTTLKNEVNITKLNSLTPDMQWKRYTFIGCKQQAFENKQFGTINITKQIKMHIEVFLTKDIDKASSLVHLTQSGRYGLGQRLPFIDVNTEKATPYFHVAYDVNGDYNYYIDNFVAHAFNRWITIEVSQLKEGDDFIYTIAFDGKKVHSVKNDSPRVFDNVKVFLGHYEKKVEQPGYVRNFWMEIGH